jgi:hypothetical protein
MSANNQPITFGDLVCVNGYGNRVFQVESYRKEEHHYPGESWAENLYDLFDMGNGDYIEADAEDLTLVADASQADEYLRANPAPMEPSSIDLTNYLGGDLTMFNYGNDDAKKKPAPKPTARELSGQEAERRKQARKDRAKKIDACLDWMNYYREQGGADAEAKVAEIKQELAELVEAGDGR